MRQREYYSKSANLVVMMEAAFRAARSLTRDFSELEKLQVSRRGVGEFGTSADEHAEKVLREHLSKAREHYGFVFSLTGETKGTSEDTRWLIDPLSGRNNFLHGLPHFALSIALEKKEEIIAVVVFDPIKDEMFWAEKGAGAFLNKERLRVSARNSLSDALVAGRAKSVHPLLSHVSDVRVTGATALDLAYVAAGRLDGAWDPQSSLCTNAAGTLLVQEAGGIISDQEARGRKVHHASQIVAANIALHSQFVRVCKA